MGGDKRGGKGWAIEGSGSVSGPASGSQESSELITAADSIMGINSQ